MFPSFGTQFSITVITKLAYTLVIYMGLRSIVFVTDKVTGLPNL